VTRSILWLRRDLRLADHPAAAEATRADETLAVFVLDPKLLAVAGRPRLGALVGALGALDEQLLGRLTIVEGDPTVALPALAGALGAETVVATADFGPYGRRRDEAVRASLAAVGCRARYVGSPYAIRPGTLKRSTGEPFSVFTPFWRAWSATAPSTPEPGASASACWLPPPPGRIPASRLAEHLGVSPRPVSERRARAAWTKFLTEGLAGYQDRRNLLGEDGTSQMSVHLHWGTVHPRTLLQDLGDHPAHVAYRRQLAWREFYADVLWHHPESRNRPLRSDTGGIRVDSGPLARQRFEAWCAGETGYPVVDASLRQLAELGWMHNRGRMIVASFLVKDLHLPWQWGARHFLRHLADADLASNQHGWQWTAGTGTDAAPYYRIFNPVLQGRRFDPDGRFVRRWVPELEGAPTALVHEPGGGGARRYVTPIVDHALERTEALRRFEEVRTSRARSSFED